MRSPGVRLSAYFINGFEHGSANPLLESELYNMDHLMLNLRHGAMTWMSCDLFHELQTSLMIIEWSLRSLILIHIHGTITLFFSTGSENRVAKPLFVPQTGFLLHSVKPLYGAALCVCVCVCPKLWSDVEMWRAKWIRNLSSAVASDIWPGPWPAGHSMLHLWSKRAIYFAFPAFFPPASSFLSFSIRLFLLESHPGSHSAPISCSSCCNAEVYWQFPLGEFEQRGFCHSSTCYPSVSHLWATFMKHKFLCKL